MTKANEQYLVEQAEHYLHGGMHYTTLQKSSENYVDSFLHSVNFHLYNSMGVTKEQVLETHPNKVKNSFGHEIPIHEVLYKAYNSLKEALPWINVSPVYDAVVGDARTYRYLFSNVDIARCGFTILAVYCPGDTYAMGVISVDLDSKEIQYILNAPLINNTRYKEGSTNRHCVKATKIDKFVANCKKYLRPYSPTDCMLLAKEGILRNLGKTMNAARGDLASKLYDLRGMDRVKEMVSILYDIAVLGMKRPLPYALEEDVLKIRALQQAWDELIKKQVPVTFVVARNRNDIPEVGVVNGVFKLTNDEPVIDMVCRKVDGIVDETTPDTPRGWQPMDQLPDTYANKVAALDMLKEGEYVEGLGIKFSPTEYWVVGDDETQSV
jgi:hypothetical protein